MASDRRTGMDYPAADESIETVNSQCWECAVMCGASIEMRDGEVSRIRGNRRHPYSHGLFCMKGVHAPLKARNNPRRLSRPLVRNGARGEGRWREVSFEEALDRIADGLTQCLDDSGPLSIGGAVSSPYYSRGAALQLFLRSCGSPNIMINQDLCQGARQVSEMVTGTRINLGEDVANTECIMVVGKSPSESDIVRWGEIKAARKTRNTPLIVVDPRKTKLARTADLWLPIRPGTDLVLALGMINWIITTDSYDREFVGRWCHGFPELADHARSYPLDRVERITGIDERLIAEASKLYSGAGSAVAILGHGIDGQVGGVQTARAFHALISICGNIDVPGGHRLAKRLPRFTSYWDLVHDPDFRLPAEIEYQTLGAEQFPLWSGPEGWAKACHNPTAIEAMIAGSPYPLRGLYVTGVNIAVTYPGSSRVREALMNLDFLAVATDSLNPTALLADVVLPKTTSLEEEEVSWHPGGPTVNITQQVLPPIGEARSDVDALGQLAKKMRTRGSFVHDFVFWSTHRQFNEYLLEGTGLTLDALRRDGFHEIPFGYREYEVEGFPTPSGRVELYSQTLAKYGLGGLPRIEHLGTIVNDPDEEGASYPLLLLTGIRSMAYHHSRFRDHDWARRSESLPQISVNPDDALRRELTSGDWVRLVSPAGSCELVVAVTEEVPPGIVGTGMGWWWPERLQSGDSLTSNINNAVAYVGEQDHVLGAPNLRRLPCELEGPLAEPPNALARERSAPSEGSP